MPFAYNSFSRLNKLRFGGELRRICIDGGFTCPNRDGSKGTGGCVFCGERGAGERIEHPEASVREQVAQHISRYEHRQRVKGFAAYFQNFSSTYAPLDVLRSLYDSALEDSRVLSLIVGTRPDCIDEQRAALLGEYTKRCHVSVELGLQTWRDDTADRINRCYKTAEFTAAVYQLAQHGVEVTAHVMAGLPGEDRQDFIDTIEFVNAHPVSGIKLHSLYVMKNTPLEQMYHRGEYTPLTLEEYCGCVCEGIAHLRADITVQRITGDCCEHLLVAPKWCAKKRAAVAEIQRCLSDNNIIQGMSCEGACLKTISR